MKMIYVILLALFASSSFASFEVVKTEDKQAYAAFNNFDLLESYYKKEISYKEFERVAFLDLEGVIKDIFNCDSLTEEIIVKECMKRWNESTYLYLGFVIPQASSASKNKELHDLSTKLYAALTVKIKSINAHPVIKELLESLSTYHNSFMISDYTFFTEENNLKVKKFVDALVLYPKNVIDPEGFCNLRVKSDSIELGKENVEEMSRYNSEKCKMLTEQTTDWIMSSLDFSFLDVSIRSLHPRFKQILDDELNAKIAEKLISQLRTIFYQKDSIVNFASDFYLRNYSQLYNLAFLHPEYEKPLNYLINTSVDEMVRYEGINGIHVYLNDEYREESVRLAENFMKYHDQVGNFIKDNNLSDVFVDTNTTDEKTRLEPIDLVTNLMYRKAKSSSEGESIGADFKNYLKEVVNKIVGLKDDIDHPIYISPRKPIDEMPNLFCAFPEEESGNMWSLFSFLKRIHTYPTGTVVVGDGTQGPVVIRNSNQEEEDLDEKFSCSEKSFHLTSEKRISDPLKLPNAMIIKDGYVDILMPYSLTNEMNEDLLRVAKIYFKSLRYKLKIKKIENVKAFVGEQISRTDVLMPAGHSLASRNLSIGTKSGQLLSFTRKKRRGDKFGIRFKFILPDKTVDRESINISELAKAYKKRMQTQMESLFVFVISCNSEGNLSDWSLIYRKAMEMFKDDNGKLPYVIASSRGFPTSSNIDIAGSVFYPSDVADMLAKGFSPKDVFEELKIRKYGSIAEEFIKRLGRAWLPISKLTENKGNGLGDIFKKPESDSYSPVYNLSDDYREMVLKMSGKRFKLFQDDLLIMDETY